MLFIASITMFFAAEKENRHQQEKMEAKRITDFLIYARNDVKEVYDDTQDEEALSTYIESLNKGAKLLVTSEEDQIFLNNIYNEENKRYETKKGYPFVFEYLGEKTFKISTKTDSQGTCKRMKLDDEDCSQGAPYKATLTTNL